MRELILKVGAMLMPLGFMVSLVDYQVYGAISFITGFVCLLELIDLKLKEKNKRTSLK
jgi:hypothetical protein